MVNPPESDDPILQKLEELPDQWDMRQKKVVLKMTVPKQDASWVSERIYEHVDEGSISANIEANHSKHSVDLTITLSVSVDLTPIIAVLSLLLYEIKTKTISNYLKKRRENRRRNKIKN